MKLVAIDPGAKQVGYAVFDAGVLAEAGLCKPGEVSWLQGFDVIVAERPQVYVQSRQKGDPNDLVTIALVAGEFVGAARAFNPNVEVIYYKPSTWKRNVPKEIHHERVQRALKQGEREQIKSAPKSLLHNVLDAVGIGLFELGRLVPN